MSDRIDYRALAAHIAGIDLHADCLALVGRLVDYPGAQWLVGAVLMHAKLTDSWMIGLSAVSVALQAQNARFDRGMFEEWCVEGY